MISIMKFERVFLFVCWLFVAYLIVITVSSCSGPDGPSDGLPVKTDRHMFSSVPGMPPIQGTYALWAKTDASQMYGKDHDGLTKDRVGRVWPNPLTPAHL